MFIYAIKDVKVGFMSPVIRDNDELMKRDFFNVFRDKTPNQFNMNPEDFELYRLGEYDQKTGAIVSNVEFLASALSQKGGN